MTQSRLQPVNSAATQADAGRSSLTNRGSAWLRLVTLFGQRLAFGGLVLLAIIYLSYLGLDMARGAAWGEAAGLAFSKSFAYLGHLLQGYLGLTAAGTITGNPAPVASVMPQLVLNSLGLLLVSLLVASLLGVGLGLLAAQRRRSNWSVAIIIASMIGISVPSFFAAPLLQLLMVQWTRTFGEPLLPLGGFGWDKRLILPALVLAARPAAQITRMTMVSLSEVLGQDFIRVAQGKGLRGYLILWRHELPNIAIPVLTTVGLSLRFSLSSLPVVEFFFGWPGLGRTLLQAIALRDDNLTVALVLCLGLVFIGVNLLLELLYYRLDPRLREAKQQVRRSRRESLAVRLGDALAEMKAIAADNPVQRWLARRQAGAPSPAALPTTPQRAEATSPLAERRFAAERRRALGRGVLRNPPLVIGGLIVLALIIVVLFGPQLAPHSPYTTQGLIIKNGEFIVPPFPPGETHPWGTDILGRDLLSLVLAGAQQTLLLAAVVVLARLTLGAILGALAGWWSGSWLDRLLLALTETIAAFPTLLLTMLLILAFGIRQGLQPFILAFCFVGWGEVMQFVRGQVLTLRPKLFIESAVSMGLRTPRILRSHVLPNLIPALISMAALEMGAVLILLGELGFIGIFIGGGTLAEVGAGSGLGAYHYSDVPEWGALLSNIRTYARTYAWIALYPISSFFVAILGFNLFGEGLRRLVDNTGITLPNLFNRYTAGLLLVAVLAFNWAQSNTGALVFYRQQAHTFSGQSALDQVQRLTEPQFEGRALGTPGLTLTAQHLAAEFERLGLQPAGQKTTYFYERKRTFERLTAVPELTLDDNGPAPLYQQDFTTFPSLYRNLGQATGPVRFMTTGPLQQANTFGGATFQALRGLDFSQEILLVLSSRDVASLRRVPHAGMLVIAEDEADLSRHHTLLNRDPTNSTFGTNRRSGQDAPVLWISEAVAERLLAGSGYSVASLRLLAEGLVEDQYIDLPTGHTVSLAVKGDGDSQATVAHVLGYLPGTAGVSEQSGTLNSQMIIVVAPYDAPPPNPDGRSRPAANDNASGVAVMLEAIRAMQESGYQPYKTFLFVAYSAEGLEGGEVVSQPDPSKLLQVKQGFSTAYTVEAVVQLRGLGAGTGDELALSTSGSQRLANLFELAARQAGVSTTRVDEAVDLSLVFNDSRFQRGQEAPQIGLSWAGWQASSGQPGDTVDTISAEKLEKAGRTLSLALMIMGRETEY